MTTTYGNGAVDQAQYDAARGWLNQVQTFEAGSATAFLSTIYTRSATGRVASMVTETASGSFDYAYDYAGRLRTATSRTGVAGYTQSFTYNRAGSMTSNSRTGTYAYGTQRPRHAPVTVTSGNVMTLTYDLNGNMFTGLDGKIMTYDGENRPLSVRLNGKMTRLTSTAPTARG